MNIVALHCRRVTQNNSFKLYSSIPSTKILVTSRKRKKYNQIENSENSNASPPISEENQAIVVLFIFNVTGTIRNVNSISRRGNVNHFLLNWANEY